MNNFSAKQVLVTIAIFSSSLLYFLWMNQNYPFYFIWDMDHTTTVDLLLIQSGEIPAHINHTGYGMYLTLMLVHRIFSLFGYPAVLTLKDLSDSIQPIIGVAELTDFLRRMSVAAIGGTILLLWVASTQWIEKFWQKALALVIFIGLPSLLYHSAFIRSELYSILFFSGALALLSHAATLDLKHSRSWWRLVLFSGLLSGISYITKLQGIFYFIFLPIFYYFLEDRSGKWNLAVLPAGFSEKIIKRMAGANFVLCLFFILGSHFRHVKGATFTLDYSINMVGIGYIVFSLLLLVLPLSKWKEKLSLPFFQIYLLGFHLSFFTHFLIYRNPATSLKYMLFDAKMIFFRNNYYQNYAHLSVFQHFKNLFMLTFTEIPFQLSLFLVLAATHAYLSKTHRARILSLLVSTIAFVNATVATRAILRDLLWVEVLLSLVIIMYAFELSRLLDIRWKRALIPTALALLLLANGKRLLTIPMDTDANFNSYGFKISQSYNLVYDQMSFQKVMERKYSLEKSGAPSGASSMVRNYVEQKRIANFTFPNQRISIKNLGYFYENAPVSASGDRRIKTYSPELAPAILVDNFQIPRSRTSLVPQIVINGGDTEAYSKIDKKYRDGKSIASLPRRDYGIYLFFPEEVSNKFSREFIRPSKLFVTISSPKGERTLRAMEITNFVELDPLDFSNEGFYAILPRN